MALTSIPSTNLFLQVQNLIPNERICKLKEIKKGHSCKKYRVTTETTKYFLRIQENQNQEKFLFELKITQIVADLKIGPQLIAKDIPNQLMLLQNVCCKAWPSFKQNSQPYFESMRLLKLFHRHMKPADKAEEEREDFAPFSFLIDKGNEMKKDIPSLPKLFSAAIEKINLIYKKLLFWLRENATYYHGDFHTENALFDGKRVYLIDWETTALGDPFLDVVKFSLKFDYEDRITLLAQYLEHEPSAQEKAHFHLMDLAFLIVVVVNRMSFAYNKNQSSSDLLTQQQMQQFLDSPNTWPSYLSVSYSDTSPKARQIGALYALKEFSKKIKDEISFEELLEAVST